MNGSKNNSKPRLLFLAHRFPYPLNRGDRIRSFNLLRFLAGSYDVSLGTPTEEKVSPSDKIAVGNLCQDTAVCETTKRTVLWNTGRALLSGKSLTEGYFHSNKLHTQIHDWHREQPFDAVFVYCSSMYPYVATKPFQDTPKLVDLVDVDSEKWRQLAEKSSFPKNLLYQRESKCVQSLEQLIASESDGLMLISDDEVRLFRDRVVKTDIKAVSNGVDSELFCPPKQPEKKTAEVCHFIFTGALDYEPNLVGLDWFCDSVWSSLHQVYRSRVCFDIVGRNPTPAALKLGERAGVTVHANVPNIQEHLHASHIAVCPLHLARGIQNKVLEAMSCGLPTVVAPQSAEGIEAIDGVEFMVADQANEWIESLSKLVEQSSLREEIGQAARSRIEKGYSWTARLTPVDELLKGLLSMPPSCLPHQQPAECTSR